MKQTLKRWISSVLACLMLLGACPVFAMAEETEEPHDHEQELVALSSDCEHVLRLIPAQAQTCYSAGNMRHYECVYCGKLFADGNAQDELSASDVYLAPYMHVTDRVRAKDATCTEEGNIEYYVCKLCGHYFNNRDDMWELLPGEVVVPVKGHNMVVTQGKEPTCTEGGMLTHYTCIVCRKVFSDPNGDFEVSETTLLPSGHAMIYHEAKAATCAQAGNFAYYTCGICGKYYADESGIEEITQADTVLTAPHQLKNNPTQAKEATCVKDGNLEYYTCKNCGQLFLDDQATMPTSLEEVTIPAYGHNMTWVEGRDVTCTKDGIQPHYHCEKCNKNFVDENGVQQMPNTKIPATQHEGTVRYVPYQAATCSQEGVKEHFECDACGMYFDIKGNQIPKTSVVIPAGGHVIGEKDLTPGKPATCTQPGTLEYYTCQVCKQKFADIYGKVALVDPVIPVLAHKLTLVAGQDATCDVSGTIAHYHCSSCNGNFRDEAGTEPLTSGDMSVNPTGHSLRHVPAKTVSCGDANNSSVGNIEHYVCDNCGKYYEDAQGAKELSGTDIFFVGGTGHDLEHVAAKDATCTEAGNIEHYLCRKCGKYFEDAQGAKELTASEIGVSADGHKLTLVKAQPATCTEPGTKRHFVCGVCGKLFNNANAAKELTASEIVLPATGHSTTHVAGKAATCTGAGTKEHYACGVCGKTFADSDCTEEIKNTTIPAAGHTPKHVAAKDAACGEKGNIEHYVCQTCGKFFEDFVCTKELTEAEVFTAAKTHDFSDTAGKAPTCTTAGNKAYCTCKNCGKMFTDHTASTEITDISETVLPAAGHTLSTAEGKAATCTEAGIIEHYICGVCGKYFEDKACTKEIAATATGIRPTGHQMAEVEAKEPTCTEPGAIAHYHCAKCDGRFKDQNGMEIATEAILPPKGHTTTHVAGKAPTCTEPGIREHYVCDVCDKYFADGDCTDEISATDTALRPAHTLTKVDAKEPTATTPGNITYYICGNCGKYFTDANGMNETTEDDVKLELAPDGSGGVYEPWDGYARYDCKVYNNPGLTGTPILSLYGNTKLTVLADDGVSKMVLVYDILGYVPSETVLTAPVLVGGLR